MDIELIKSDLHYKVKQLIKQRKTTKGRALKIVYKVKSWSDKVAETEDLINKVYHTLHEVLQQHDIHFKNEYEKEGFVKLMEPTVNDLVIKNIED